MLKEFREPEIDVELARQIASLACRSFDSPKTIEERTHEILEAARKQSAEIDTIRRYVIYDDHKQVIAHAKTFVRDVVTVDGCLSVLALATVCTDPDRRGAGLGAQVTRKAFERIGQSPWPDVSLFQTPVPVFYEKLDCRIVNNRFVDRTNLDQPDAFPWRDDTIMIYPQTFDWPNGTIDINGPDY